MPLSGSHAIYVVHDRSARVVAKAELANDQRILGKARIDKRVRYLKQAPRIRRLAAARIGTRHGSRTDPVNGLETQAIAVK